ncbi:hypothetical protein QTP86_029525 [Hemibagrus guttatus]|nr:hypothetical protein QTP86_029525 [Hemibagrus guttatus]
MSSLNKHSNTLIKVYRVKTKDLADEMKLILDNFDEQCYSFCALYDTDFVDAERDVANTVIRIYNIRHEGAELCDPPSHVGLIVEGVKVLGDVTKACALLLGVIYSLNVSYPSDLKYTFEFFQKVLLGFDAQKLSHKIQVLKNKFDD